MDLLPTIGYPPEHYYGGAFDLAWKRIDMLNFDPTGKLYAQTREKEPSISREFHS